MKWASVEQKSTFSYELEGTGVNVEPGGGSIMGYAGITSDYDVQASS
jgi:hypothetical protein